MEERWSKIPYTSTTSITGLVASYCELFGFPVEETVAAVAKLLRAKLYPDEISMLETLTPDTVSKWEHPPWSIPEGIILLFKDVISRGRVYF